MLTRMLARAAESHPSKAAIVQGAHRISYRELRVLVDGAAAGLHTHGIARGDCVAVTLGNCPEFVVSLFACARLGAILLPVDHAYSREERQRLLAGARPKRILTSAAEVEEISRTAPADLPRHPIEGGVLYLYTSGSTGQYKRLCCTQANLYWEARNFVDTVGLTADDSILCTIPLTHSYGLGNCLLDAVYTAATLVLLEESETPFAGRARAVLDLMRTEAIRFYPGVPYQFDLLAAVPRTVADPGALRLCVSSGDMLAPRTFERFRARFGLPIRSLYGSTEAGSIAIDASPDAQVQYGSLGPPLRNVSIEIRDAGEVWVKSPVIPPTGYDNLPDLTQAVFRDGFYNTGDIGRIDEQGRLFLTGRKQSFINVGGYKVDIAEVEDVLASCPGVREAAVLGVEVPRVGMLVKAAVVTDGPCREAEIRAYCRQKLAFYKVPRWIEPRETLPRTAVGKVLRGELGGVEPYLEKIRGADAARILRQIPSAPPARRRSLLTSLVQAQAAAVLGRTVDAVPRDTGFIDLGMDSFGAIELLARLEILFDRELPETFTFDHPTVDAVADELLGSLPARRSVSQ